MRRVPKHIVPQQQMAEWNVYNWCIFCRKQIYMRNEWHKKIMNYTQYCNSYHVPFVKSPTTIMKKKWLPSLYTPANDKMLFFQGVGDSSQGFANFILYCALTDKVRERVFAAIFLRKPNHHSTGDNPRRLRASTVETQPSSHEVTRTEEVVNWPTM